MVSVVEKFLLVLGLEKRLGSESTFEVVRYFINCEGKNKIVLFDPRISLDDQDIKLRKLRSLAYRTNFGGSPLARILTGLIKVLPFGCSFSFTGDIISYCSRMSSNLLTLSCKWIGNFLAHCFLKTASGFKGRRRGDFFSNVEFRCGINCWVS